MPATTWLNLERGGESKRPDAKKQVACDSAHPEFEGGQNQPLVLAPPWGRWTLEGGPRGLLGRWLCNVCTLQNPIQQVVDCFCLFYMNSTPQ